MDKPNEELSLYAKNKGVPKWAVANQMGISEATLIRWLRFPLTEDKKSAFIRAVDIIATGKGGTDA